LGAIFSNQATLGTIFDSIFRVCPGFMDLANIFIDFAQIFTDFLQIKTFEDALAPPPPTPLVECNLTSQSSIQGRIQGGRLWRSCPLKPTKVTWFTMIFYNLENCIRDIRPFCSP